MLRYVLQYSMVLHAGREGPDQTARMRRLIRAPVAVRICPKIRLCMVQLGGNVPYVICEQRRFI